MLKFFEDARQGFLADADAAVFDSNRHGCIIMRYIQCDAAIVSELGGIAEQVEHDLFDLVLIGKSDECAFGGVFGEGHSHTGR